MSIQLAVVNAQTKTTGFGSASPTDRLNYVQYFDVDILLMDGLQCHLCKCPSKFLSNDTVVRGLH